MEYYIFFLALKTSINLIILSDKFSCFFFLQNDLYNEQKSKIKYIQQCANWYFVTKKGNVKTGVNKITKQNNLVKSVTGDEKHY